MATKVMGALQSNLMKSIGSNLSKTTSNWLLNKYSIDPESLYSENAMFDDIVKSDPSLGDKVQNNLMGQFGVRRNPVSQIYNLFQSR